MEEIQLKGTQSLYAYEAPKKNLNGKENTLFHIETFTIMYNYVFDDKNQRLYSSPVGCPRKVVFT